MLTVVGLLPSFVPLLRIPLGKKADACGLDRNLVLVALLLVLVRVLVFGFGKMRAIPTNHVARYHCQRGFRHHGMHRNCWQMLERVLVW